MRDEGGEGARAAPCGGAYRTLAIEFQFGPAAGQQRRVAQGPQASAPKEIVGQDKKPAHLWHFVSELSLQALEPRANPGIVLGVYFVADRCSPIEFPVNLASCSEGTLLDSLQLPSVVETAG